MALKHCDKCNKVYAEKFSSCPHCNSKKSARWFGLAALAIVSIVIYGALRNSDKPSNGASGATNSDNGASAKQSPSNITPAQFDSPAPPAVELTTLIPKCVAQEGVDCSRDEFQKVWARIEADNGEVTKIDMKSLAPMNTGAVTVTIYSYAPNTMFDIERERLLTFDCAGHYMDISDMGMAPLMNAPPRSVVGEVAAIVCAEAKARQQNMGRDTEATAPSPLEVTFDVAKTFTQPVIGGDTNLPDNTQIILSLRPPIATCQPPNCGYATEVNLTIKNGHFSSGPLNVAGGNYVLEITTGIGGKRENFKGQYVKSLAPGVEPTVDFVSNITIVR